jgi:hypothetical protein
MKQQKYNPPIGGYFKHEGRIYIADEPDEHGKCFGCCFYRIYGNHFECWAPPVNCAGKIMVDVTDVVDAELIEEYDSRGIGFAKFFVAMAIWIAVIIYTVIKYNSNT